MSAVENIYVERSIYDEFVEKLAAKTRELKVGNPFDMDNDQGALVAKVHYDKVMSYLKLLKKKAVLSLQVVNVLKDWIKDISLSQRLLLD